MRDALLICGPGLGQPDSRPGTSNLAALQKEMNTLAAQPVLEGEEEFT